MNKTTRLTLSALIAFIFYGVWAYVANIGAVTETSTIYRVALVQGLTSATITLVFTLVTEWSFSKFYAQRISFAFVTPLICLPYHRSEAAQQIRQSFNQVLDKMATKTNQMSLSGVLIAPLVPMSLQATVMLSVNIINATPNLWLTVAPSIFFSGLYGYLYTFSLYRAAQSNH